MTRHTFDGAPLTVEQLADLPMVKEIAGPIGESLDRTYYDTPDLRLATAGVELWRDADGWRAVFPGGREIGATGDTVPTELHGVLVPYVAGRELAPSAHVATERERWRLLDRGGVVLAEVVYDNVTADGRGRAGAWRTVRAEPHTGDRRVTDRLATLLLHTDDTAKDTNLASFLGAPDTTHQRSGKSVADVLTGYLRRQLDALRAADLATRLDEPEGVHDLRVATRRLRACLRVFRRYFVADRVRSVTAELKWLSGWLGDVRDSEVLRQQITGPIHELSGDLVLGPVQAEVDRHLSHSEAETARALHDGLDSRRYLTLHDTLDRLTAAPPLRKRATKRAKATLSREIGTTYRKTRTAVAAVEQAAPGAQRDSALHAVRKKVRRLRYACEVAEPALGKPAKKTSRRSKKIQGVLGDHHDAVVARPVLRQLGAAAHLEGGNGFTFGVVHGLLDERAARQEADFGRLWLRLAGSGARRRLTGGR